MVQGDYATLQVRASHVRHWFTRLLKARTRTSGRATAEIAADAALAAVEAVRSTKTGVNGVEAAPGTDAGGPQLTELQVAPTGGVSGNVSHASGGGNREQRGETIIPLDLRIVFLTQNVCSEPSI